MEIMNMKLKMMATLWDNTYRVAIDDGQGKYIGTARVVVNVPLPPEALPENAPQVEAQLLVLVEDFDFGADKIINFETTFHNRSITSKKLCKIHSFFCLFSSKFFLYTTQDKAKVG